LVVFPGIGDSMQTLVDERVADLWSEAEEGCDLVLLDAHFTYYREGNLEERVRGDVLLPARERGYDTVWLIGFSIGGYGALWAARENPELVDGVVLIAPMIGVPPRADAAVAEIREAGGLGAWTTSDLGVPRHHLREPRTLWAWLREATQSPDTHPEIHLAYGRSDRAAPAMEVLAEALPEGRIIRRPGGHEWTTWRVLLGLVFARHPWRPGAESSGDPS
jgi:pimeloyl-ACP methyl ester carboxylesterase